MKKLLFITLCLLGSCVLSYADDIKQSQFAVKTMPSSSLDLRAPSTNSAPAQQEEPGDAVPAPTIYYKDARHGGYWWYELDPEKNDDDKTQQQKKAHFLPDMKNYSTQDLWNMHPKDFQPLLDAFLDKAVQTPTPENVADYYKIQDVARARANSFANVAEYVWATHPELNTIAHDRPAGVPGKVARIKIEKGEIRDKIFDAKEDFALVFFYQVGCEYCDTQRYILQTFVERYGWEIRGVNIAKEPMMAEQFGVTMTPTLLLIYRNSQEALPISNGVIPANEIEGKIYRGIRLLAGEITPQEFNMYEYQRGGAFDPTVYSNAQ